MPVGYRFFLFSRSDRKLRFLLLLLSEHCYVVALIGFWGNFGGCEESHLDSSLKRAYLGNDTVAVLCADKRVHGGSALYLVFVCLMLVFQATHKSAAYSRYFSGVE